MKLGFRIGRPLQKCKQTNCDALFCPSSSSFPACSCYNHPHTLGLVLCARSLRLIFLECIHYLKHSTIYAIVLGRVRRARTTAGMDEIKSRSDRPKSRQSIAHLPSKANTTTDIAALKRAHDIQDKPKRSRGKSLGPGGLEALTEIDANALKVCGPSGFAVYY